MLPARGFISDAEQGGDRKGRAASSGTAGLLRPTVGASVRQCGGFITIRGDCTATWNMIRLIVRVFCFDRCGLAAANADWYSCCVPEFSFAFPYIMKLRCLSY